MLRRRIVLAGALVLLSSLISWGTWAYFSTSVQTRNVITTGTIRITLNDSTEEAALRADGSEGPTATLSHVMPGRAVDKAVSVTNSGTGDAWVRVKVDTAITSADGSTPLATTLTHDSLTESVVQFAYQTENGGKWLPGSDGFYYYTEPLATGSTTDDLFDTLTLNKFLSNDYQGCTVDVDVNAQAVQVRNNTLRENQTVLDVQGWPVG